jgi:DNA polymerase II large subunit
VEEYWTEQLKASGYAGEIPANPTFREALELSSANGIPMHPRYIYEYSDISMGELGALCNAIPTSSILMSGASIFDVESITLPKTSNDVSITDIAERLCIPHRETESSIIISGEPAHSLLAALGFADANLTLNIKRAQEFGQNANVLDAVNSLSLFKVMRRSTRIGGRIGRPEKAKERLMKPSPNLIFPVGEAGGRERSLYKAYNNEKRKFGGAGISVEIARYRCVAGREVLCFPYCSRHKSHARLELKCSNCGMLSSGERCRNCGGRTSAKEQRIININAIVEDALKSLGGRPLNKNIKGVRGLFSRDKVCEPVEKGILRANNNVHIFKDGTSRFDATDMPMTHFYPKEVQASVERLKELGYGKDYLGNELQSGEQLLEMRHQDVIINKKGAEHFLNVARFIDQLLVGFYGMEPFYNIASIDDLIGHYVITLSPHTSAGVLCRIAGFTDAHVGFAHPYVISARRRNCDGDEDTTMLLLDALINFSRSYLPVTIGGTMDAPLILTIRVEPAEVDDEVHEMEVTEKFGLEFYERTFQYPAPSELAVETVKSRLSAKRGEYSNLMFTHLSSVNSITGAPQKSMYTKLNSMKEKIEAQFRLMDMLYSVDRQDTARKLILSHFIPDLIGNMHSFSRQSFRCVACNAKYRRVPLVGKCTRCSGKIVLTISKGSIEKYLTMAIDLANRYNLEPYLKQRLLLIKEEISNVFGGEAEQALPVKQFNLSKFM